MLAMIKTLSAKGIGHSSVEYDIRFCHPEFISGS
jgi:hypothetical protein